MAQDTCFRFPIVTDIYLISKVEACLNVVKRPCSTFHRISARLITRVIAIVVVDVVVGISQSVAGVFVV